MNIIDGDFDLAVANRVLMFDSDSPSHLLTISAGEIDVNEAEHSVARALASMDLPTPEGPYRSTPFHGVTLANRDGYNTGRHPASLRIRFASVNPEMLSQPTDGLLGGLTRTRFGLEDAGCSFSLSCSAFVICSLRYFFMLSGAIGISWANPCEKSSKAIASSPRFSATVARRSSSRAASIFTLLITNG